MSLVEDKQVVEALSSHRLHPPLQNRVRPGALNRSHLLNAETSQTAIESRVVATITDLDRLFAEIKREKGKLDIVFANAGVAKYAPFGEITGDLYEQTFGIDVKGVLFTVQKALPLVPDGAAIILNASIVGSKGLPANSVYSATKAAVRSFARTWTTDLKPRRIRVNAVSPGTIETPGLNHLLASSPVGEQRRKMISNAVPLGRFGTPDEIAKAVVFLASDDASYITGTELFLEGGFAQIWVQRDQCPTRNSPSRPGSMCALCWMYESDQKRAAA